MDKAEERVAHIRERMEESASRAGRDVSEIKLAAVTKTRTLEEMLEVAPFVDALGENRIQEAEPKITCWPSDRPEWRFIGHLQRNKIRRALTLFDTWDSLDSAEAALSAERIAEELGRFVPVLIEVNTSGEASKTGAPPEDFSALLDCVTACARLKLEGFMTMGPLTDREPLVRSSFAMLRDMGSLARERTGLPLPVLSMGMSGDFEWAILEGSTMIRVGTLLFAPR